MKQSKLTVNLDGLEDIARKVGSSMRARVGVLGSDVMRKNGDGGITNAELMLIHMFGSVTRNIPPRDALLMPIERNRRELIKKLSTGSMRAAFMAGDYKKMFRLPGQTAEQFVQEAFETGGWGTWPPDAPATIAAKGSSAILINFGELRRSVSSDVVNDGRTPPPIQPLASA